jgi:sugar O-acyltransferase (sialic acid O-acetyltransferase NeuD family)
MPIVASHLQDGESAVFIDDGDFAAVVNGYQCVSWENFLRIEADKRSVCLAVANGKIRETLEKKCSGAEIDFFSPRSEQSVIMDAVEIGDGAMLSPFVTIASNVQIGRHFHANLYSYVEHDCIIGDFVTFAPGVKCNGNVRIKDHAYIGSGAILRQGTIGDPLVIGEGAVIGMGAVVTKSVPAGVTMVGNPAQILKER